MHALAPVKPRWSSLVRFCSGSFDKARVIICEVLGVPDKLKRHKCELGVSRCHTAESNY